MKGIKAISLLSGGLDSILATRLILEQGIEVEAFNFTSVFQSEHGNEKTAGRSSAERLGVKVKVLEGGEDYFKIIRNPKYGYGRNINPCIDCRIFIFKEAARHMKESGASFLITGEVLGERPMSQRRDALRIIDRDSALEGLILRPLSAKLLEPTIPEKNGWVNREKLLAIKGRSRKPQFQLARDFGITEYLSPAGGCLLTDPGFTGRMKDLMKERPDFTVNDVMLLKVGRHFRLKPETKLIVGRREGENNRLLTLVQKGDLCFSPVKVKGPIAIGRGSYDKDAIYTAASIVARYSDIDKDRQMEIACKNIADSATSLIFVLPITEEQLNSLRI